MVKQVKCQAEAVLKQTLAQLFDVSEDHIDDLASPETIQNWDSLQHITLVMEIERAYSIRLSNEEALTIKNVKDIKKILRSHNVDI